MGAQGPPGKTGQPGFSGDKVFHSYVKGISEYKLKKLE